MASMGERVRELRKRAGMTQDDLAARTGMSKGFLSDIENGNRNVSSEFLLKLANALGASIDYLLRGEDRADAVTTPVVIPHELSVAAEQLSLSYADTLQLLDTHRAVVGRRSEKGRAKFTVDDWKNLHAALKKVFN